MVFVKSIQVGKVETLGEKETKNSLHKEFETAFLKKEIFREVFANKYSFEGDEVADTKHHGGVEKAIFANSFENYSSWEEFLGKEHLPMGALGENLTISGLDEKSVCVGDIHMMGSLVLQVSQPRKPCFKISKVWGAKEFASQIHKSGQTGWYYRVLEEGSVKKGDKIEVQKDKDSLSIMDINQAFANPKEYKDIIEKIIASDSIMESWKQDFVKRVKNLYDLSYMYNM